jgi:hypothetical protein
MLGNTWPHYASIVTNEFAGDERCWQSGTGFGGIRVGFPDYRQKRFAANRLLTSTAEWETA